MISSPALNSSSLESASSRSRSFSSSSLNRSEQAKAHMQGTRPDRVRKSTADAEAEVGESRLRRPGVAAGAAQLRRVRVPCAAARAPQRLARVEPGGAPFPDVAGAIVEAVGAAVLRE